ncbi:hypothetical protein [Pseudodonghicola xiamenensis]|uniref:Uncharacterized protein n=1 Tax=Pseudodonghicola xiamenensis TaxID=337702 RepID=A0A8J3H5M8_9RHOB|nr:hypothetical protein [Pseudodonghicola xiamenensis]GHG82894.1 hypothetical protein GCM10010961_07790 [Pseudodonghicola xiamenensis]
MVISIFRHAVKMIFSDMGATLRISIPMIVLLVVQVLVFAMTDSEADQNPGWAFSLDIFNLIASLWVAVAWHRYVLMEHYPQGLMPEFRSREMLVYFAKTLLLIAITVLPAGVVFALILNVGTPEPVSVAVLIVLALVLIWVTMRLSVLLPAAAIGRRLTMAAAWRATQPISLGVIGLVLLIMLTSAVLFIPVLLVSLGTSVFIGIAGAIVVQWFCTLLSLSVLTTLYGVYVEGRALD